MTQDAGGDLRRRRPRGPAVQDAAIGAAHVASSAGEVLQDRRGAAAHRASLRGAGHMTQVAVALSVRGPFAEDLPVHARSRLRALLLMCFLRARRLRVDRQAAPLAADGPGATRPRQKDRAEMSEGALALHALFDSAGDPSQVTLA